MDSPTFLRPVCLTLSLLALAAGAAGMVLSALALASSSMADITAGTSGFVAGAVLIGSGLLSLTALATRPAPSGAKGRSGSELD